MNSRSGRGGAPCPVTQSPNSAHRAGSPAGWPENAGGSAGSAISSGLQETILTYGTPAVSRAGKEITLSSTMTSGRVRATISASCSWQYRAPLISSAQTGLIQVSSCSMVGLRNSGAVLAMNSFQNAPASWTAGSPCWPGSLCSPGGDRSTRSSSKPSGSSRPFHEASAANTTRCPRRRRTSPIPMQLLVGPYALSGMNRTVRGLPGMSAPSGRRWAGSGQYVRIGRPGAGLPGSRAPIRSPLVRRPLVRRRVLHQGEHAVGHEPGGAHHRAAPGDLHDLHDAAPGDHLDAAAGPGGGDLIRPRRAAGVDDDLDPVPLHGVTHWACMSPLYPAAPHRLP